MKNINEEKVNLAKTTFNGILSLEIGQIVGDLSSYFFPKNLRMIAKAGVSLGTFFISQVLTDKISYKVENIIDKMAYPEEVIEEP